MDQSAPPREIWLCRHGVTTANRDQVVQGHADVPLDAEGEEQARRLGRSFSGRRLVFGGAVASDLSRARRTAELVLAGCAPDLALQTDPAWREACYGELEGRPGAELQALRDLHGPEAARVAPPGGESLIVMQERVVAALTAWSEREVSGSRLLVVTHGGPIAALTCHVLDVPLHPRTMSTFRRDNTGVTVLRRSGTDASRWRLARLNEVAHLDDVDR